ncbi:MAG TPA: protein translocase subunit SecD [Mycobacteriales bacterium]|nr:protein translocase subunit SecD [Mycobacteriales bacterium]
MAPAAKSRPGRTLALVGILVVGLYLGLIFGPSATPKLGLDLRGGTQVILTATPLSGGKITSGALNQAVDIIRQRVDAAGVGGALINTQGSNTIIVSAPGANRSQLNALDQTALLNFRQVLAVGPYSGSTTSTTPTPSPSAKASTAPSSSTTTTTKTGKKQKKSSPDALRAALLKPGLPQAKPSPSPSASPSASPSPSPSASTSPSTSTTGGSKRTGPAPGAASTDLNTVQQTFQSWDCSKDDNPTAGVDSPEDYIVACDDTKLQQYKYLLAPAGVKGSEIKGSSAVIDPQTNEWQVDVSFHGSQHWLDLTQKAAAQPDMPSCGPPSGCNAVAIVLDGVVQSAPRIVSPNGIPGGQATITGQFTQTEARTLANVLKFGALPLKLNKQSVQTVSASLGSDQLHGGLIAGAIGLGLVVLYSLLYYRALGLVTVASLALSGGILYAATTLLGHSSLGYTLSLPGIAGFIVAVGITADSFVVFFERLRDEIREGRRMRSAVEHAWPRARRTIISADAVSLLAAVVLYIVSIGDVRGFAFTLGLSTLSDLFIVFFFTRPLLALMARIKGFDTGASWTGLAGDRRARKLEPKEA